jgi:hypothetical protein
MLGRTAAQLPYAEASQQVEQLAGFKVDPSQIQRLVQLLGPPAQERIVQLPALDYAQRAVALAPNNPEAQLALAADDRNQGADRHLASY